MVNTEYQHHQMHPYHRRRYDHCRPIR